MGSNTHQLFYIDSLSIIMMSLVGFVALCVASFAMRYLKGDSQYRYFFMHIGLLVLSVLAMVSADNLIVFFVAWCLGNVLLVRLMIHKASWSAAKSSGLLAFRYFTVGAACIATAFMMFYQATGTLSIKTIVATDITISTLLPALVLLTIGAMIQSAIWPFHKWLLSSLNAPTPVSAIMHAGLVNGGGFLLVRFAPLYFDVPLLLTTLFIMGVITSLLGSVWKLIQNDVKRMLASSTMAQMGFMIIQCGLGLFPAAVAHLVLHGLFKSYLFLASDNVAQQRRFNVNTRPTLINFSIALICGFIATLIFGYITQKSWLSGNTTVVLLVIAFTGASQLALTVLSENIPNRLPIALLLTSAFSLVYGLNVQWIALSMDSMQLMQPQALNSFHVVGMIGLVLAWLAFLFITKSSSIAQHNKWLDRGYVFALNASQPQSKTVTPHRKHYQF